MIKTAYDKKLFLNGSIWDKLILFALPLLATSILQQAFNSADMAIVGRFSEKADFAAVGSTGVVISLMIELFMGLSIGSNVIIARFIGKGDIHRVNDAIHTSVLLSIILGISVGIAGMVFAKPLLSVMQVPEDIINLATLYLKIYSAGLPFLALYNFCSSILRSKGNSTKPFFVLLLAGGINVILNIVLVAIMNMGVAGVAIATVISNAVSALLLLYHLCACDDLFKLNLRKLHIDYALLKDFAKIGIPSSLLGCVFSISNICVQSSVNSLGTNVISASSAASNVEIYIQFLGNAFAQAATTFISQNYGSKNYDRCNKITRIALAECVFMTLFLSITVFSFGRVFLKIFTTDSLVIEIAVARMKYTLLFKFIQCIMDIMVGCLQGYGYTLVPSVVSVFSVCVVRLLWIFLVFPKYRTLESIMVIYPITQALASIGLVICYMNFRKKYFGKIDV